MPVHVMSAAVAFYRDRLGFEVLHHEGGFAVMVRDEAVVHLWEASDETWRQRDSGESPLVSGAESFIAGTASAVCESREWTSCTRSFEAKTCFIPSLRTASAIRISGPASSQH
jgi:hypothetical protein